MKFRKNFAVLCFFGGLYLIMELLMRTARMELADWNGLSPLSLAGWTSLWMFPIGGLCGLLIGLLNERRKMPVWLMAVIGTTGIYVIELVFGLLLNVWLELRLWSYEGWPLTIGDQITFLYLPVWFLLTPLAIWIDDSLRHLLYGKDRPEPLRVIYMNLFKLR
ncbi:MAG: hypothetical protein ACOC41_01330 [Chitinivibrionales bacterium]